MITTELEFLNADPDDRKKFLYVNDIDYDMIATRLRCKKANISMAINNKNLKKLKAIASSQLLRQHYFNGNKS